jgi:hypothetical protein
MSDERKKFRIIDEKIPFGERLSMAISQAASTFCIVIAGVFLLPVNFFRTLFTSKRRIIEFNITRAPSENGAVGDFHLDDEEDWKKAHREQYGDE